MVECVRRGGFSVFGVGRRRNVFGCAERADGNPCPATVDVFVVLGRESIVEEEAVDERVVNVFFIPPDVDPAEADKAWVSLMRFRVAAAISSLPGGNLLIPSLIIFLEMFVLDANDGPFDVTVAPLALVPLLALASEDDTTSAGASLTTSAEDNTEATLFDVVSLLLDPDGAGICPCFVCVSSAGATTTLDFLGTIGIAGMIVLNADGATVLSNEVLGCMGWLVSEMTGV